MSAWHADMFVCARALARSLARSLAVSCALSSLGQPFLTSTCVASEKEERARVHVCGRTSLCLVPGQGVIVCVNA